MRLWSHVGPRYRNVINLSPQRSCGAVELYRKAIGAEVAALIRFKDRPTPNGPAGCPKQGDACELPCRRGHGACVGRPMRRAAEFSRLCAVAHGVQRDRGRAVLDAQRTLLTAEVAESRTMLAQFVAVVQLYRALGGGWDAAQVAGTPEGGS